MLNTISSLLDKINKENLDIEISLKLTHIGLDLSLIKRLNIFQTLQKKQDALNNKFSLILKIVHM